jgi:hypothetical protein
MYSNQGSISGIRSSDSPPKTSSIVRLTNLSELPASRVQTSSFLDLVILEIVAGALADAWEEVLLRLLKGQAESCPYPGTAGPERYLGSWRQPTLQKGVSVPFVIH